MSVKAVRKEGKIKIEGYYLESIEESNGPIDLLRQSILRAAEEVLESVIKDNEIVNWLSVDGHNGEWRNKKDIHMETVVWISAQDPLCFSSDLREMFNELFTKVQGEPSAEQKIVEFSEWLNNRLREEGLTPYR